MVGYFLSGCRTATSTTAKIVKAWRVQLAAKGEQLASGELPALLEERGFTGSGAVEHRPAARGDM